MCMFIIIVWVGEQTVVSVDNNHSLFYEFPPAIWKGVSCFRKGLKQLICSMQARGDCAKPILRKTPNKLRSKLHSLRDMEY